MPPNLESKLCHNCQSMGVSECYLLSQVVANPEILAYLSRKQMDKCTQGHYLKTYKPPEPNFYDNTPNLVIPSLHNGNSETIPLVDTTISDDKPNQLSPASVSEVSQKLFEQAEKLKAELPEPPRELNIKVDKKQYSLWTR